MNDFVRGKDVEFVEPILRSEDGQDAAFRELISPCLPPPVLGFDDTNEVYRGIVEHGGSGYATGPFSVYRFPMLAGSAHQRTVLMRMTRFRFASGILDYFFWTKYARLDLERCEKEQENSNWLFQLGDDTRAAWKYYFTDGIVRLGDEFFIFTLSQAADSEHFDPAAGPFYVNLWKLQSDIRALSVLGFHAE
jgi:hypothetical protein